LRLDSESDLVLFIGIYTSSRFEANFACLALSRQRQGVVIVPVLELEGADFGHGVQFDT
jgi:hypothetical protein